MVAGLNVRQVHISKLTQKNPGIKLNRQSLEIAEMFYYLDNTIGAKELILFSPRTRIFSALLNIKSSALRSKRKITFCMRM